jgi:hypothetical protein
LGLPTASMQTSAPLPPVSAWMAATGSVGAGVDRVGGAELGGQLELAGVEVDGDDGRGPGQRAPAMAAQPTPPQPKTATSRPG